MNIIYDDKILKITTPMIESLRQFAIGMMDINRQEDPKNAFCWNYCVIEFIEASPTFMYGGCIDDIIYDAIIGPSIIVSHPDIIKENKDDDDNDDNLEEYRTKNPELVKIIESLKKLKF
jgi:hypothetical protein